MAKQLFARGGVNNKMLIYNSRSFISPIARQYFAKVNALGGDVQDKKDINDFVIGLSRLIDPSLWVCWPLRSGQSIGSGTAVPSLGLLGNYPGVLVNGPTWGVDGINRNAATAVVQINSDATLRSTQTVLVAFKSSATADNQRGICCAGGSAGDNFWDTVFNNNTAKQAYLSTTRGGIGYNGATGNTTGRELLWNFWGAALGSTEQQSFFNGVAGTLLTGLTAKNATGSANVFIGATSAASSPARGDYSFAFVSTSQLSGVVMTNLYTLYKQTMGRGLGFV